MNAHHTRAKMEVNVKMALTVTLVIVSMSLQEIIAK